MGISAWLVLLGCATASFIFALAEISLFTLGEWRARRLAEKQPVQGKIVLGLLSQPHDLLATIALGNTLANAAIIGVVFWQFSAYPGWKTYLFVPVTVMLILLGCEVIPKTLAMRNPETWVVRIASAMRWLMLVTRPLRSLANWLNALILRVAARRSIPTAINLTDEEYQELVNLAFQQGALAASEKEIILQIIALDRRTVQEVMKPRTRMMCISDDLSVEEMLVVARKGKHRRLPIYDETPDTIVGVLNTQALLLNPQMDLADAIEFPSFVPASMNLLQLMKSLQRQQRGLAIVLDEFGGTAGVVSMEDILEVVVGEIRSEGIPEGFVMEKLGAGRWRVNGTMRVEDFQREYPELTEYPGIETLGGLVTALMEVVPSVGNKVLHRGLCFTVLSADERRVREVLVEKSGSQKVKEAAQ